MQKMGHLNIGQCLLKLGTCLQFVIRSMTFQPCAILPHPFVRSGQKPTEKTTNSRFGRSAGHIFIFNYHLPAPQFSPSDYFTAAGYPPYMKLLFISLADPSELQRLTLNTKTGAGLPMKRGGFAPCWKLTPWAWGIREILGDWFILCRL